MEYYPDINREETLTWATVWTTPDNPMLSERSHLKEHTLSFHLHKMPQTGTSTETEMD
jgi:hypothetical protein